MNSAPVHVTDTVPAQGLPLCYLFRHNWTEPSDYLRKPNVLEDKNDNQVATSTLPVPDSRNILPYDIQLLFFMLFLPACSGFIAATVAIVACRISIRGAVCEVSSPPLKNPHN